MEKTIIIIRGISGCGKSTFAKTLGGFHFEADMYFIDPVTGEYNFDPSKIKLAHQWCQDSVKSSMTLNHDKIVVSNTFTQEWEMQPYFDLAKKYNYKVFTIIIENRHGGKNTHNVPDETLEKMRNRFEFKI